MSRSHVLASATSLVVLIGCPSGDPAPIPDPTPEPTPAPFDPSGYEVLTYELTEPDEEMPLGDGMENVFAAQRFYVDTPGRIIAVEATFKVRSEYTGEAHLAIWPDWGHNFFDWDRPNPLAEWNTPLDRFASDEQWTVFELDEPIVLTHPQLLYVGSHYRGEDEQPRLMTDSTVSEDPFLAQYGDENTQYPPMITVYPDRGRDSGGFETVSFAGFGTGDLLVRLYIERTGVVDQAWFTEQQSSDEDTRSGLSGSGSVAWGDCNGDGWLDVYNGNLYMNAGDGTFALFTDPAGITIAGGSGMWGDYDNDGNLDLFVAQNNDQLYRGAGDCTFENVTAASQIDDTQLFNSGNGPEEQSAPTPSAAWLDANGDGWLDLYQANFMHFSTGDSAIDMLWINQGDGTFVDGTLDSGLNQGGGRAGRGVHPADWDNDGDTDIYVSNYRLHQNFAWQNDGEDFSGIQSASLLGGYRNGTPPNSYYGHTIGSVWGDVDNDGDLDLFAANLAHPRFYTFSDKSMFLRNELVETGATDWTDMRWDAGMLYQETDSSPILFDFDNDGWLDLFYTAIYSARPSYLYRNNGDWTFSMVSYEAGTWIWNGWGVAAADYDNDGDMDIYGGKVLRNETAAPGGWINVEAVGNGAGETNLSGIGARIYVTTAAGTQMREVTSGVGVGNQMPLRQHVGLGEAPTGDVRVEFPISGTVVQLDGVTSGTRLRVFEDGTSAEM